jgi:hypothetical protein
MDPSGGVKTRLPPVWPVKQPDESYEQDGGSALSSSAAIAADPALSAISPHRPPEPLHPNASPVTKAENPELCIQSFSDSENVVKSTSPTPIPPTNGQSHTQVGHSNGNSGDVDSYLPVGVLWKNLDSEVSFPEVDVTLLENHRWVRTQATDGSNHVQVYVHYKMTSRGNTQRSITKLRNALKTVMAKIDRSPQAWYGNRLENGPERGKPDSAEDESLWYIFNTLRDPCPQVENMNDHWAQRAMEQLLSEDHYTDLGLKTKLYPYQRRSAATMVQREAHPARMLDPRLQAYQSLSGREYYYDKEDAYITLEKVLYSEACGGKSTSQTISTAWMLNLKNRYSCRDHGLW